MIIATIGEKGGGGKSTLAIHFITAYFLKSNPDISEDSKLKLFEFDAHNVSTQDISSDKMVSGESVGSDTEKMIEALSSIEFQSFDKDVVVDVGGSDNTDRFLELIAGESFASDIVFVVPEMNKRPRSAENTVEKLRAAIPEPKIVIALNRFSVSKSMEDEYKFFFGDSKLALEASPLAMDDSICVATVPLCDVAIGLAEVSRITLWQMAENTRRFGEMSLKRKKELWGTEDKKTKVITPCDEETFIKMTKELYASKTAKIAIDQAQPLFDCLDKQRRS